MPIPLKTTYQSINRAALLFLIGFFFICAPIDAADENPAKDKAVHQTSENAPDSDTYHVAPPLIPTPEAYGAAKKSAEDKLLDLSCGNKAVDSDEECDDGNRTSGDGCSSRCKKEKSVCGDGIVSEGEGCGEADLPPCLPPNQCQSCQCVPPDSFLKHCNSDVDCPTGFNCTPQKICTSKTLAICGNGSVETGEQCNEPGLACGPGLVCNQFSCLCVTPGCGDGVAEPGEQCGEPGLACGLNEAVCNSCKCVPLTCGNGQLDPGLEECDDGNKVNGDGCSADCRLENNNSNCGFLKCSQNSDCQIQYCADELHNCTWGDISSKSNNVQREPYKSGTVSFPEACAQVSWQAYASFDPCTGKVESYEIQVTNMTRTGGSACICPVKEPSGEYLSNTGQIIGCSETVNGGGAINAWVAEGTQLHVTYEDCCGTSKTIAKPVDSTIQNKPPVSCIHPSTCPNSEG